MVNHNQIHLYHEIQDEIARYLVAMGRDGAWWLQRVRHINSKACRNSNISLSILPWMFSRHELVFYRDLWTRQHSCDGVDSFCLDTRVDCLKLCWRIMKLQDKFTGKAKELGGSITGDESKKTEGQAQNLAGKVRSHGHLEHRIIVTHCSCSSSIQLNLLLHASAHHVSYVVSKLCLLMNQNPSNSVLYKIHLHPVQGLLAVIGFSSQHKSWVCLQIFDPKTWCCPVCNPLFDCCTGISSLMCYLWFDNDVDHHLHVSKTKASRFL